MIDQRRCKYIKTIAAFRSFSRAAQELYVSQPSLSRFVKKVEDELGIELFDRDTVPLSLTPAGEKYLQYIDRFQQLERTMLDDFSAMNVDTNSHLILSTLPFLGTYVLPKIIPRFASSYPSVDLQIEETNSRELLRRLESGAADLVLTNLLPDTSMFDSCKICPDHIMLAAPDTEAMRRLCPGLPASPEQPAPIDLALLEKETLIVLRPWQNMRAAAEAICQHYSFAPQHVIEAPSLASALSLVGCNRGITFVCQSSVSCIRPETPLLYFSAGEMQDYTSILAVYRKGTENPLIHEFCTCASRSLMPATPRMEL